MDIDENTYEFRGISDAGVVAILKKMKYISLE
jgi:hypothetical protein